MILNRRELLTEQQREDFISIPFEKDEHQISVFYMLSIDDIEIINKHRKDFNISIAFSHKKGYRNIKNS